MFAAILVSKAKNKIIHSTSLKNSVQEVEESLNDLPDRFKDKKKFFQIVKLTDVFTEESSKYGVVLV